MGIMGVAVIREHWFKLFIFYLKTQNQEKLVFICCCCNGCWQTKLIGLIVPLVFQKTDFPNSIQISSLRVTLQENAHIIKFNEFFGIYYL